MLITPSLCSITQPRLDPDNKRTQFGAWRAPQLLPLSPGWKSFFIWKTNIYLRGSIRRLRHCDNKQSEVPGPGQELGSFLHLICNFHQVIITPRQEPLQHQRANWNAMKPWLTASVPLQALFIIRQPSMQGNITRVRRCRSHQAVINKTQPITMLYYPYKQPSVSEHKNTSIYSRLSIAH